MILSEQTANRIAELLLQINAIKLNPQKPYTWASGWQSPIYTDNRTLLSYPEIRNYVKEQFVILIKEKFSDVELIAGVATAGIPHGAIIADALNLPFCYVRSAAKSHGLSNMIEGRTLPGQKTVVIEDLVSTGGSSINAIKALRAVECNVLGLAAIFSYNFEVSALNFKNEHCAFYTLSDYSHLIKKAVELNYVHEDELLTLEAWRKHPESWTKSL
jgi:orotate phosphoribosyltransferase